MYTVRYIVFQAEKINTHKTNAKIYIKIKNTANNNEGRQNQLTAIVPAHTEDQPQILEHEKQTSYSRPPSIDCCTCT